MAKLSSTNIYGDLIVDGAITENGQLLSSKYAAASHGTHLTLGTGSGNAYRGDYGNTAYTHSQAAHAPSNAQKNSDITKAEIEAKLTGNITSHTHSAYAAASHGTHLSLGTTSSTAYRGDYGNTAYTHSQAAHAPSNAQKNSDITKAEIEAKLTGAITSHKHTSITMNDCSNKDFNTIKTAGWYFGYTGMTNAPVQAIGVLEVVVYSPDWVVQRFTVIQEAGTKYERHYYNGNTWSTWRTIYDSKNKPTPADIGAAAASHGTHLTIGTGASNAAAGNHTHSYLPLSGGQVTGKIYMPSSATTTDSSHPTQLAYGLLGAYGTLKVLGNTDTSAGDDNEYVHIAAGWGLSPAADKGITVHGTYANCFGKKISTEGHAHNFLNIKGTDTITSKTNDTTANWGSHGNSVHFYTVAGQLTDQPSQWGYILNIGKTNEVHQIWMTQASGDMFHRGGNAGGWSGTWRKILDSSNWSSYAAASSHNHTQLTGEVRFPGSGSYTDPWSGITCAIKATGNVGITGTLRTNTGIYSTSGNGVATADGATYAALLRYKDNRGYCDLGNNNIPGRLYIRSGQGTAGSGVLVECAVTNGNAYMQYLSPEAGTIALTKHLSDRTRKENIVYIDSEESEFTNKDFYNFIKENLELATYNLKKEYAATDTHTKLNFIAQDILWDFDKNEENKVGNLIIQAEDAMEQQVSLKYDPEVFTSVIAGALKESINKIEELEDKNKKLEERLAMLEEKFSALENK